MKKQFDPGAIKAQIDNLKVDRDKIDHAIQALETALRSIQALDGTQRQFTFNGSGPSDITLLEAVKRVCAAMKDAITKSRVINEIERQFPLVKPKPSSVSAALINLTKGDQPMLKVSVAGQGRSPSVYSTDETIAVTLSGDEIEALSDPGAIKGVGGWQTLWKTLQDGFDKASGSIQLSGELRAKIYNYYRGGTGGWQNRVKRVFRRELPHLFAP